jgi:hypothetical protein
MRARSHFFNFKSESQIAPKPPEFVIAQSCRVNFEVKSHERLDFSDLMRFHVFRRGDEVIETA